MPEFWSNVGISSHWAQEYYLTDDGFRGWPRLAVFVSAEGLWSSVIHRLGYSMMIDHVCSPYRK